MSGAAVDTNILAYAADIRRVDADDPKRFLAKALIEQLLVDQVLVLPAQVCLELHHLLVRKGGRSHAEASLVAGSYVSSSLVIPTDGPTLDIALELSSDHRIQIYDAVILSAAARAGCDILYSEDMQDGFEWEGVKIINPFA